jgi:hypothetical protein
MVHRCGRLESWESFLRTKLVPRYARCERNHKVRSTTALVEKRARTQKGHHSGSRRGGCSWVHSVSHIIWSAFYQIDTFPEDYARVAESDSCANVPNVPFSTNVGFLPQSISSSQMPI